MTLQQLRYLIAISQHGTISGAAHALYTSQSSLSVAIKDLERECGVQIFERSNKGISLTRDGLELLSYARQIIDQVDLMEAHYSKSSEPVAQQLSISSQHYAFPVEAFLEFVQEYEGAGYRFSLRETKTYAVIDDVREFRSDVGILYTSTSNEQILGKIFQDAGLSFHPLFYASPHVFVGEHHDLAGKSILTLEDLKDYPRYAFDQGSENSFFYAEEPLAEMPHEKRIMISDRGTLSNLLSHHNGFTISTGVLSSEMHSGIASIPLKTTEKMCVGYLIHEERQLSVLAQKYIEILELFIEGYNRSFAQL